MKMTTTHIQALNLIYDGAPTPSAVARQFRVGYASIMKILTPMKRAGLIGIDQSSIWITDAGKSILRGNK